MSHDSLLMPHPVLQPTNSDYADGDSFSMSINRAQRVAGNVKVDASFDLSCSKLERMLDDDLARFFVTAQCPNTHFRRAYHSDKPAFVFEIPEGDLFDNMTVTPYVVANHELPWFEPSLLEDVDPANGENIPLGSILAVGKSHKIQIDKIGEIQSTINFVSNSQVEEGLYEISADGDFIVIEMHPATYDAVSRVRKAALDLLYPSIYQAAVEHAIRELQDHEDTMWGRALVKTLQDRKISIDRDLSKNAHKHAQMLLEKPLARLVEWDQRRSDLD